MQQYKDTLNYIKVNGVTRGDRTGVGRHGVFSPPDEIYDLSKGFPLSSLSAMNPDAMFDELFWFISGSTVSSDMKYRFFWGKWTTKPKDAIKYANEVLGIVCDTPEEYEKAIPGEVLKRVGTIGNLYGVSWRQSPAPKGNKLPIRNPRQLPRALIESVIPVDHEGKDCFTYETMLNFLEKTDLPELLRELQVSLRQDIHNAYWANYDQLNELVLKIKNNPNSSRLRVTAYLTDYMAFEEFTPQENVMDGRAALTACHTFFQCYVHPGVDGQKGKLDLKLTLTSSDAPIGRRYNIAQYAALTHFLAHDCDLDVGRLIISSGDTHIYTNQFDGVNTMLSREAKPLPTLWINPDVKSIFELKPQDVKVIGYEPHPFVKIPVAV